MAVIRDITVDYFHYLLDLIDGKSFDTRRYDRLLHHLHNRRFTYIIFNDENREGDGLELRFRFLDGETLTQPQAQSFLRELEDRFDGGVSVLEMMVGLADRIEEHIMADPNIGNRTDYWFRVMIENLGLKSMTNQNYHAGKVDEIIDDFLERKIGKNGEGGLFVVKDPREDLRKTEIWYQMCWYLDEILDL